MNTIDEVMIDDGLDAELDTELDAELDTELDAELDFDVDEEFDFDVDEELNEEINELGLVMHLLYQGKIVGPLTVKIDNVWTVINITPDGHLISFAR